MQIPPVSAAKHNGAGSDLILNDCLAYLRFGRYCEGFRMPAATEHCRVRWRPASENLQGRKPRWRDV